MNSSVGANEAVAVAAAEPGAGRLQSLDAFRGFTIASMMIVNNPGDWGVLYPALGHAPWHGWTFTDLVFPFFLFIGGVAMTLSLGQRSQTSSKAGLMLHLMRRGALIFGIGLLLNLVPTFDFSTVRIPGVLQRIGLCVMIAAPIVIHARSWRSMALWALGLMAVYAVVMLSVPVPGADGLVRTGSLQPGQDVGAFIDRALLQGHLWKLSKTWDPEGLLSTLPAVASLLCGALAGQWLASGHAPGRQVRGLVWAGVAALLAAAVLDGLLMPINKSLWTPSFVMLTAGWALLGFALCFWLLDAQPSASARATARRWSRPLVIYGMNALFLFALASLFSRMTSFIKIPQPGGASVSLKAWLYTPLQAVPITPVNASLLYAFLFMLFMYGVACVMWRRGWIVKV